MTNIEQKDIDIPNKWDEGKQEYTPKAPRIQENNKEGNVDIDRDAAYENTQGKTEQDHENNTDASKTWGRKQTSEQWANENPSKIDRIPAWWNISQSLHEEQKPSNIVGKAFQGISKWLLWNNNL